MNKLERYLKDHYFDDGKDVITIEPKPTLSKIVKDGLQAIDNAVAGVIAKHEAEIEAEKKPKIDYKKFYDDHMSQAARNKIEAVRYAQMSGLQGTGGLAGQAALQGFNARAQGSYSGLYGVW